MCKVLVLDDDPYYNQIVCQTLRQVQEAHSYRVTSCLEAEQALSEVRQAVQAGAPFEIFVVDQRLKHGQDGIDVLRQLLNISPDSDGIILTGYDSLDEDGVRAYEAGAYRYLLKTAEKRELLFVLRSLQQWRQVQREHNWQKAMIQLADTTLHYKTFEATAQSVIDITLSLGFDQGQLFWVPKAGDAWDPNCLIKIVASGEGAQTGDEGRRCEIRNLYPFSEALELHTVSFYHDGAGPIDERLELAGFKPPNDSWAILPLWSTKELLGALVLSWQPGRIPLRQF